MRGYLGNLIMRSDNEIKRTEILLKLCNVLRTLEATMVVYNDLCVSNPKNEDIEKYKIEFLAKRKVAINYLEDAKEIGMVVPRDMIISLKTLRLEEYKDHKKIEDFFNKIAEEINQIAYYD